MLSILLVKWTGAYVISLAREVAGGHMLSVLLGKWMGAYVISLAREVDRGICYQSC